MNSRWPSCFLRPVAEIRLPSHPYVCLMAGLMGLLAAGCASQSPPSPGELTKDGHARAVVLLRLKTEIDGRSRPAFAGYPDCVWLGLGDFFSGGQLEPAPMRFLSRGTRLDGWAYLLLEPGIYYLAPHPPQNENVFAYAKSWAHARPTWRFEVPRDASALYIGTLFAPGYGQWQLFGGCRVRQFAVARFEVDDETSTARTLHEQWLKSFGPLTTELAKPWLPSESIILETPPGR